MKAPFTTEQLFDVFAKYNLTLFPFQLIIILAGFVCIYFLHSKKTIKNKIIGCYLGILWMWIGSVYHLAFFSEINKLAYIFGGLFILQGLFIFINSLFGNNLEFSFSRKPKNFIAYFFILFGLIIYPVISYFTEGSLNKIIALGLPCPSAIFTFGFFILAGNKLPKYFLIIPSLWSIIGLSAAINFGVYQDYFLIISAVIADIFILKQHTKLVLA